MNDVLSDMIGEEIQGKEKSLHLGRRKYRSVLFIERIGRGPHIACAL